MNLSVKPREVYYYQQKINVDNSIYEISISEMKSNDYTKITKDSSFHTFPSKLVSIEQTAKHK